MIENLPYPVDLIENAEGAPLSWLHNQELNRMEAFGRMVGPFLIYPHKTGDGRTLYMLYTEAMGFNIVEENSDKSVQAFFLVGMFKNLDSAIKVSELLENG